MFSVFGAEKPYKRRGNAFLPNRTVFAVPTRGASQDEMSAEYQQSLITNAAIRVDRRLVTDATRGYNSHVQLPLPSKTAVIKRFSVMQDSVKRR